MLKPEIGKKYRTIDREPVNPIFRNRPFIVVAIDSDYVHIKFLDGNEEVRNINRIVFDKRCYSIELGPRKEIKVFKFT